MVGQAAWHSSVRELTDVYTCKTDATPRSDVALRGLAVAVCKMHYRSDLANGIPLPSSLKLNSLPAS